MGRKSLLLLLVTTALNLVYNAFLPLHPDEAYYWTWSRHLELSYFDHPPMIAYLIRAATLAGQSEFAIRLVAVACMTLAAWVVYRLARGLFNERVGEIALLIMLFLPVTQAGYLIVTPDAPLILFWALTAYFVYGALWENKPSRFCLAGISAGCLLLSKYTGVLLIPALLLFLLTTRHRTVLLRKDIYLGLLLTAIMFVPVIVWNSEHDWVSFRFQLMHGMGGQKVFKPGNLGDFLGGQAFAVNPIFLLALLYFAIRRLGTNLREEKLAFLFWPFVLTFLFFLYGGLFKKSEANWSVPAYITGAVLLAYWIEKGNRRWIYYTGVGLTVIMVMLVKFPEVCPSLPRQLVMKQQFMGYREIFRQGAKYTEDPRRVILSDSYQRASEAWYYLGRKSEVFILTPSRISMYDFWRGDLLSHPPKDAVYFGDDDHAASLSRFFSDVQHIDTLRYEGRFGTREMSVYRCTNR